MFIKKKILCVKLHTVTQVKFPSLETFYTHVVADKYEVCSAEGGLNICK